MSGVEVFGATASASQIFSNIWSISKLIQKVIDEVKEAPRRIKYQENSLLFLLSIIELLKRSVVSCTEDIQPYLRTTEQDIESLRSTLAKNSRYLQSQSIAKFWRAFRIIQAEERIRSAFKSLEADKENLTLYLVWKNGITLQEVYETVGRLTEDLEMSQGQDAPQWAISLSHVWDLLKWLGKTWVMVSATVTKVE
ncbi:hypothetical protein SLS55_001814 [Diplodia seriata]|uniref:Uncharacterized protein n=1 Tax=Diplodia seriata TaxID=420778 RepID=A0ABR3CQD2_9PEZI